MFPLDIIFDPDSTMDWQMEYLSSGPGEVADRIVKWKAFAKAIISQFLGYQVPTIELSKSTSKEAVCQVFEKVNTGGVSLTVFELLTATYAADDVDLREDWKQRESALRDYPVLARIEAPQFLQVVTLLSTYNRKLSQLNKPASPGSGMQTSGHFKVGSGGVREVGQPSVEGSPPYCRVPSR